MNNLLHHSYEILEHKINLQYGILCVIYILPQKIMKRKSALIESEQVVSWDLESIATRVSSWNSGCHPRTQGAGLELECHPRTWVPSWNLGCHPGTRVFAGTWGAILELGCHPDQRSCYKKLLQNTCVLWEPNIGLDQKFFSQKNIPRMGAPCILALETSLPLLFAGPLQPPPVLETGSLLDRLQAGTTAPSPGLHLQHLPGPQSTLLNK